MSGAAFLDVRSKPARCRCDLPDVDILSMLVDRTPQAVAFFRPDLTPTYLNPALRRMLEIVEEKSLSCALSPFCVHLRAIGGERASVAEILHRRDEWHGEIHVSRDDRPHWSLMMNGRIELLRDGAKKLGFAIIAHEQLASTGAVAHKLTARERDVLNHLLSGGTSKAIAQRLGISHRTVEAHRASIMRKFDVKSLPDLFRLTV